MPLTTDHWNQLQALFDKAASLAADQREAFLRTACGDDHAMRQQIQRLLQIDQQRGLLDSPIHPAIPHTSVPSAQTMVGKTIGRYKLVRLIASGGMGTVYEAQQDHPRRSVALKLMHRSAVSRSSLRRFEAEADILGRLQHQSIAQIHDAGVFATDDGPQPFFAMELIDGLPICEYANTHNLGTRQRLDLLEKVCQGAQHAHSQGVIHRDLKPANILVDRAGEPKILDFGIARVTSNPTGDPTTLRTDVGQLLGTLAYMSPEQVLGDPAQIDARTDVYALGVIAYELLTGRLPHDVQSRPIHEAVRAIREDEPTPLSSVNKFFRGDLETIIGKALEKDRARRYQSAGELAADLHRYLSDEPVLARQPSAMYQLRKFARRNKALVGGVIAVFITLVIGVIGTTIGLVRAEIAASEQARLALRATQAEQDARARLEQTVNLLIEMITAYDNLNDLPGATKTRELLAQRTVDALPRDEHDGYGELSQMAAYAFQRMGEVQLVMGLAADALASHRKALEIRLADVARTPGNADPLRSLAVGQWKVAEALMAIGRHEEAGELIGQSLDVLQRPEVAAALGHMLDHYVAAAHRRRGDIYAHGGMAELALHEYTQSLQQYDRLLATAPGNTPSHQGKAMALRGLAEASLALGRPHEAITPLEESLQIIRQLEEQSGPANVFARTHRALGLMAQSRALAAMGEHGAAIDAARQAQHVAQALAEADPFNFESRHLSARATMALAFALVPVDSHEAELALDAARSLLDQLHRDQPQHFLLRRDMNSAASGF